MLLLIPEKQTSLFLHAFPAKKMEDFPLTTPHTNASYVLFAFLLLFDLLIHRCQEMPIGSTLEKITWPSSEDPDVIHALWTLRDQTTVILCLLSFIFKIHCLDWS
jgi:hypothetical protein